MCAVARKSIESYLIIPKIIVWLVAVSDSGMKYTMHAMNVFET